MYSELISFVTRHQQLFSSIPRAFAGLEGVEFNTACLEFYKNHTTVIHQVSCSFNHFRTIPKGKYMDVKGKEKCDKTKAGTFFTS